MSAARQQMALFRGIPPRDPGGARRTDPRTSHSAAQSVVATDLETICLLALRKYAGGLTTEELAAATHLSLVTVSPRMAPLSKKGLVIAAGKRDNSSGRKATVWKAQ